MPSFEWQVYEWWSSFDVRQAEASKREEYQRTFGVADEVAFATVDCELVPFVVDYCIGNGRHLVELSAAELQAVLQTAEVLLRQSKRWYPELQGNAAEAVVQGDVEGVEAETLDVEAATPDVEGLDDYGRRW